MSKSTQSVFSLSEIARLKNSLKNPEEDFKEICLLLEKKIEEKSKELGEAKADFVTNIDITDRKKTEQLLKESEERYRGLINNITDIIYELDIKGKCTYVSNQLFAISGFHPEELLGQNLFKYLHQEDFSNITEKVREAFNSGNRISADFRLRHKDGHYVPVSSNFNVIRINDEQRFIGVLRDNTEKRKVELKLRESEEKFRNIAENSITGISIAQDNQIKYVNKQAAEILGYNVEEMTGWSFNEVLKKIHPDDLLNVTENMKKTLNNEADAIENLEYRIITKSGGVKWTESYSSQILFEGKAAFLITSLDITEKVQARQKLRESEEKFRTITEQSLMGIIIIQDGRVIYVNNAESNIMEYSASEILEWEQEDLMKHIHPDDLAEAIHRSREHDHLGEVPPFFSYRIVTKSGKAKNVEVYTNVIEFNEKPAILTYVLDVTDKKEAEQKYENLINNLTDIILELDMKAIVTYASPQCFDIIGYRQREIIGKNALLFIHPEDIALIAESMKKAFNSKEIISVRPYKLMHKNGGIINASARGKYVNIGGNERFIVAIRDITFQKRMEQELQVSEEKYRLLFDNSPVGIGLTTINGKMLDSNDAMVELTGFTAEDLNKIGVPSIYVDPNIRSTILKLLQKNGKLHDYEVKLRRKDSSEFLGSVSFDLIELGGEKIIQTTLRDITKSKNAELELIKLNKLKSELLRRTSHELKTPLVSIKGFSDLLLELHREKMDDYVVSTLNEIQKGCVRLENLISDILKTAELESGTIQAHKSEEDLSFLIRLCVNELKGLSELRMQTINIEIIEPLLTLIEKEEIHQVISNILSNAIKYTPPNGAIEIRSEIQNNSIIISVKDNGMGFTDEEKDRIFKQFGKIERYGQGIDIVSEGSGLGLYISKKIIELHGGKIWMESEGRNKGSTFYFSLPLIEKF